MNKEINIMPRRSGKTTELLQRFMDKVEKGEVCRYICLNRDMVKYVERVIYDDYHMKLGEGLVLSARDITPDRFCGSNIDFLFVDDYLLMKKSYKQCIRDLVNKRQISFISNTTSDTLYDKELIELTRLIKSYPNYRFDDHIDSNTMLRIYEKYFLTLLTDPDCDVNSRYDDAYRRVPPEVFETEYMGKFLK